MKNEQQKFGLKIAVKNALDAIQEGKAPSSIVLSNLFFLQKSEIFPKHLDKEFFFVQKYQVSDQDKKLIVKILDELKKPQVDKQQFLESCFFENWTKKKAPISDKPVHKKIATNKSPQAKSKPKALPKQDKAAPTIIVKKVKL